MANTKNEHGGPAPAEATLDTPAGAGTKSEVSSLRGPKGPVAAANKSPPDTSCPPPDKPSPATVTTDSGSPFAALMNKVSVPDPGGKDVADSTDTPAVLSHDDRDEVLGEMMDAVAAENAAAAHETGESGEPAQPGAGELPPEGQVMLVNRSSYRREEPFKDLFPVSPRVRGNISKDLKECGPDPAHPVEIWREKNVLIDGNTTDEAAEAAGVNEIYAICRSFPSEDAALEHALRCQVNRRNLTDRDIYHLVLKLDERYKPGRPTKTGGKKASSDANKSAAETAKKINTSTSKVERARRVRDSGDEELQEQVRAGDVSISGAAGTIRKKEAASKQTRADAKAENRKKAVELLKEAAKLLKDDEPHWASQLEVIINGLKEAVEREKKARRAKGSKRTTRKEA